MIGHLIIFSLVHSITMIFVLLILFFYCSEHSINETKGHGEKVGKEAAEEEDDRVDVDNNTIVDGVSESFWFRIQKGIYGKSRRRNRQSLIVSVNRNR